MPKKKAKKKAAPRKSRADALKRKRAKAAVKKALHSDAKYIHVDPDEPASQPPPELKIHDESGTSVGGDSGNWKIETQRPTFEDTSAKEARLLLGLMRDRAVFLANTSDEVVKQLRKGFNDRTIAAYDRVLQLIDPTMKRFEFRTEIRFADKASADAAAAEMSGETPK